MRSEKYNIGIIGCGKMGRIYADWFSKNPYCIVKSFYNRTFSTARALSAGYPGSRAVETWREITADPELDIVGVCTPSHEHPEQFIAAVESGKHTICEKPMANNVNECALMAAAAKVSGVRTMIGFQMRYHPVVLKVTGLAGRIGRIYGIDFHFGMHRPEVTWKHKIDQEGGVMKELLSHLIDLAAMWLGDAASVFGVDKIIQPGREVEDFTRNIIEYENGATVCLAGDLFDRRSKAIHGNIMGTEGQIGFSFSSYDPADSMITLKSIRFIPAIWTVSRRRSTYSSTPCGMAAVLRIRSLTV
jgi:predicted dehydrogenase